LCKEGTPLRINNNLLAINTHRQLGISADSGAKSMEKLSSGFRINRAGDDAAGLAISEKMRGQIRGLAMSSKNSSDTISLIKTAEGALGETHSILQRMRELAVQSANDTNTDADRAELQAEVKQLKAEIDRIGNTTEFNTKKLLEGSAKGVAAEMAGTARVNNNSSVVLDSGKVSEMMKNVGNDRNWTFDGAFMLVKTNQSKDVVGNEIYNAGDYQMVGPDGTVYKFLSINNETPVTSNQLQAGTIIADGGTEQKLAAGATTADLTLGANVDETQVTTIKTASVLAAGSSLTLVTPATPGGTTSIAFDDIHSIPASSNITYSDTGIFKVGGTEVSVGSSITADSGAVIRNDGGGTFTVVSGSLVAGADITVGTNVTAFNLASQSTLKTNSVVAAGGTTLVEATSYKVGAGELTTNVTLGNSVNLTNDEITSVKTGSVLSAGSDIAFAATGALALNVAGKEIQISYDDSTQILKVGDAVVAGGKSATLEDGTVITNQGKLADPSAGLGKISISSGNVTLAQDVIAGTGAGQFSYNISKDSTLLAGSKVAADTILSAGTVITAADSGAFAGSVTLAHGGTGLQFSANAKNALDANYYETAVGDSFTFVFTSYTAASSNLGDSMMSQIGSNSGQTTFLSIGDMRAAALGVEKVDISSKWGAATAIETVNSAVQKVSHQRSLLGAMQNRLEHTIKNLDTAAENLQAAESRIRDVDMAAEVMEFTKNNILQQASQAMLAQANATPQSVLRLLR
jgi:flagellin